MRDYQAARKGWGISRLYVEEGLYHDSVKRYVDLFGSQNVAIFPFETMARDSNAIVSRALEFLGLDSSLVAPLKEPKIYNSFSVSRNGLAEQIFRSRWVRLYAAPMIPPSWRAKLVPSVLLKKATKPSMDSQARSFLQQLFTTDVAQLEKFLGYEMPFTTTKEKPTSGILQREGLGSAIQQRASSGQQAAC